ncbi:MAG: aldo/keto reductase [Runella slithyformis]|nr:MAG: aldo/keto reductase [Runella slithyformis]TAE95218.1 MAG: aldo/keto reductase [Runella slithyformis]TAF29195.1 MAG: aldo/keto reductase [Runella slithyformis]TAF48079.1 MAG: aldo/keto reductase [Runella slithyformis]TAF82870.1 MAG: aldo/keto reductase [Runella slithyformis]
MNYKLLGKSGLRVSELCLGTMTFGTEWGWGADQQESKKIFDTYANAGGNFLDTANRYTEGSSERFLGDFIAADRDHFVVATKYALKDRNGDPNFAGNHRKNMIRSVNESLKRLNTEFIDLFWLHMWDNTTPVDEILRGLDDLISSGKVQYIGISDTPAWVVSQANTIAELRGWSRFVALQIEYSLIQRAAERDLLPMAKAFDMAVTPWGVIGGGALTGKYLRGEAGRVPEHSIRRNSRSLDIAQEVVNVATELGVLPAQVAINWARQRVANVMPIVGARHVTQLKESLQCLAFTIPVEMMTRLDEVSKIELGFPHDFLASEGVKEVAFGGMFDKIQNHRG